MTNRSLYPNLNEPWSDVDDEGIGEDEESGPYGESLNEAAPLYERDYASPVAVHHGRNRVSGSDAVNLADFQDHYLKQHNSSVSSGRHQGTPGNYRLLQRNSSAGTTNPPVARNTIRNTINLTSLLASISSFVSRAWEMILRGARWSVTASLWKKAILTIIFALICSIISATIRGQWTTTATDHYLPCPSSTDSPPCIPHSDVEVAKVIAFKIRDVLNDRAAQYICGTNDIPTLSLSIGELKQRHGLKDVNRDDLKNVFYLILVNPHWNIRWMDRDNKTVSDWTHFPQYSDLLVTTSPSLPLKCTLLLWLAGIWHILQWIVLVLICVVVLYCLVALYLKRRKKQEAAAFALVSRILDVLKYHYKKSCNKKDLLPYLAIIHVRDMLIPPSERKAREQLWNGAVHWIACHESRVRVETRRIAGEDFEVWRWIQEDPPPTEIPTSQPQAGGPGRNQGNWYGNVFDHYPPEVTTKVALPTGTPSLCIRLKNMFEPIRRMTESQCHELENAVLERCSPHGAVVHVWVDKKSPVGCVYLKMDSLKSSLGAYNALHGGWYKGKLVTAKYIPEAKYHKWFPVSVNSKTPILQS